MSDSTATSSSESLLAAGHLSSSWVALIAASDSTVTSSPESLLGADDREPVGASKGSVCSTPGPLSPRPAAGGLERSLSDAGSSTSTSISTMSELVLPGSGSTAVTAAIGTHVALLSSVLGRHRGEGGLGGCGLEVQVPPDPEAVLECPPLHQFSDPQPSCHSQEACCHLVWLVAVSPERRWP